MTPDLANVQHPFTLATIALAVGAIVRVLKTRAVGDWLDKLPTRYVNRVPKAWLPWLALFLGFVIAFLDLVLNAHVAWQDAIVPALAGVVAGAAAVGGHETIAKLAGQFIYKPKGPVDPQGPAGPDDPPGPPSNGGGGETGTPKVTRHDPDADTIPPMATPTPPRAARALLLAVALCVTSIFVQGCAAVAAALPTVIASVIDGMQVIDAIASFVDRYFVQHPDPAAQAKVNDALTKCRGALNVALRTAQGAKNLDDAKVDSAFEQFRIAYVELLGITRPYGVTQSGALRASPRGDGLEVPEPLAMKRAAQTGK